jgi:glycerol-3-phosphate dehydrogenase (NAD(P)+)
MLSRNTPTVLWARDAATVGEVNERHTNQRYLPDARLSARLSATADLAEAVRDADVIVMGVPTHGFRDTVREVAKHIRPWVPVVSLSKGFELGTKLRMSQVSHEELPGHPVAVLTGPNLAKEILSGHAAAAVVAMDDEYIVSELQACFATDLFRVYSNEDVCGSEIGGALKNVIAIAAGMADGLGAGDNTKAAVITRGLAEISRLGVAMGGEPATFAGLAGMGDLIATCGSPQSRNRFVGEQIGQGKSMEQIVAEMSQVAEGVKACRVAQELADEYGVDMPITDEVVGVCHEGRTAAEAYRGLLRRSNRRE